MSDLSYPDSQGKGSLGNSLNTGTENLNFKKMLLSLKILLLFGISTCTAQNPKI